MILLGMGPDGHTASLFPGSPGLQETEQWVMANSVAKFDTDRITFTFPVLNAARVVLLLVAGADKDAMIREVLVEARGTYPVEHVQPRDGVKVWMLDRAAAAAATFPGMSPIRIAPSVISADFGNLRADLARVEEAGADMLHVDIMDGHFVPNITFGPDIVKKIKSLTKLPLDVHLMISRPRKYIVKFVEAGAANITFHIECEDNPTTAISEITTFECTAGLSVKPKTPLSAVRPYLGQIQRLLIMTVEPGFGGQKFMPDMMDKVRQAVEWRTQGNYDFDIEVDGGLDIYTTVPAVEAGRGGHRRGHGRLREGRPEGGDQGPARLRRRTRSTARNIPKRPRRRTKDDDDIKW